METKTKPKEPSITVFHSSPIWLPQTQTWMYNQAKFLPSSIEVHIVCERTQNLDQFSLPRIHTLREQSKIRQLWDKGLRKLHLRWYTGFQILEAKRYYAQVLHSHFGDIGWYNLGVAQRAHLAHVVTFYGYDVNYLPVSQPKWKKRYQTLFKQVDAILCEGAFMAQKVIELGANPDVVHVHHLGVEVEKIAYRPRNWQPGTPLRVLIAATFTEKKGIPYALEALARIRHLVDLEITLIGDAHNHKETIKEKQKIQHILKQQNLYPQTRLLGYQPYHVLFEEAYQHHLFLSPSVTASDGDTEGGAPVALIDMASTGMPIVSSRHCDIPEVIQDGVTGLLANERDVDELVAHLIWLIEHPEHWEAMVQAGRERMEQEYNTQVQGERLAALYRKFGKRGQVITSL